MEGDPQVQADPVDEAIASSVALSEESARPQSEGISAEAVATMNAMIRGGVVSQTASAASKSGDAADDGADSDPGGESAPTGDVKPSDGQPGRRGAAAEIARLKAEKDALQSALDAVNPPAPDPTEEARTARIDKENRFRRLLLKPDTDSDWEADDWNFLQDEKTKRAIVPELQQHYDTVLAEDLKAREADFDGRYTGFQNYVLNGMEAVKGLPGVDFDAVKAAPDFIAREKLIAQGSYAAGLAAGEATIKRLQQELVEAHRDLGGAIRTPLNGGRSGTGRTYSANDVMNTLIRGGRI